MNNPLGAVELPDTESMASSMEPVPRTYSSQDPGSIDRRLERLRQMRRELSSHYKHFSATLAPTVIDDGHRTPAVDMALYMQSLQAALDLLLKQQEDRVARPDPHLLKAQQAQIELIRRDMLQISRPVAYLWGAFIAMMFVCNLMLFLVMMAHVVLVAEEGIPHAPLSAQEASP